MVAGAEIGGADKGGRKRRSGTENTCSREEGELDSRKGFVPTGGVGRRAKSVDGRKQTKTPPKQPGPAPPAAGFGVWTVVIVAMVLAAVLMLMPGREGSCGSSPSNAGENLKRREDAFQREVDEALQQSRERKGRAGGDAGEDANKAAVGGSVLIARDIVLEVLRRRERQLVKGTIKRAVTFHFAGDGKSTHPSMMARAVENFVLGNFKGRAALHLGNHTEGRATAEEWQTARRRVAQHLLEHRDAVIVLHSADRVTPESLYDLEDAFETAYLQHQEYPNSMRPDITGAVFILHTSIGDGLASSVCRNACTTAHREELIRHVREKSQIVWTRQAFVARICRDIVPFA